MKKKLLLSVFAFVAFALVLTGCTKKEEKKKDTKVEGSYVIKKIINERDEELSKDEYDDVFSGTPSIVVNKDKSAVITFVNSKSKEKYTYNYTYHDNKFYINDNEYDYSYKYDDKVLTLYAKNSWILVFEKK